MLGYGNVTMNYSPQTQPVRTMIPGNKISDSPDSIGALGFGSVLNDPIGDDHGDADLRQSNPEIAANVVRLGPQYAATLRGPHQDQYGIRVAEAYKGPFAQAQALRNNQHFNLQGLTRRIVSPDAQTQTEQGYTLPLQAFAFISSKLWNTPAGKNVAGSTMASVHPTLKRAIPTASIPTRMPWNSAPGGDY